MQYPRLNAVRCLIDDSRACMRRVALGHWLRRDVFEYTSAFSGVMMFEDTSRWHLSAAASIMDLPRPRCSHHAVCDINHLVGRANQGRAQQHAPDKMFHNYMDRFQSFANDVVHSHSPTELMSPEEVASEYQLLFDKMLRRPDVFFPEGATSHCSRLNMPRLVLSESQCAHAPGTKSATAHINIGTIPCVGWSSRNTRSVRKGPARKTVPISNAWIAESAHLVAIERADVSFSECVVNSKPGERILAPIRSVYGFGGITVKASPTGWPVSRTRALTAWWAPCYAYTGSTDPQSEYDSLFASKGATEDASLFQFDSTSNVQVELGELRARLGFDSAACRDLALAECLHPTELSRKRGFEEAMAEVRLVRKRRCEEAMASTDAVPSSPYVGDITQNVHMTGRGQCLSTVQRRCLMIDHSNDHLFTSRELYLAHGLPILAETDDLQPMDIEGERLPWMNVFLQLNRTQRLLLVGNGIHSDPVGAFVLFVLSNLVHFGDLAPISQGDMLAEVRLVDTTTVISDDEDQPLRDNRGTGTLEID